MMYLYFEKKLLGPSNNVSAPPPMIGNIYKLPQAESTDRIYIYRANTISNWKMQLQLSNFSEKS